jgi:hypothetical protein
MQTPPPQVPDEAAGAAVVLERLRRAASGQSVSGRAVADARARAAAVREAEDAALRTVGVA